MSDFSSNDRKVIPIRPQRKNSAESARELRAATAAGSLGFVMLLIAGLNFSLFQAHNDEVIAEKVQRSLASLPAAKVQPQWTQDLQKINKEMITQQAQKPSVTDTMVFGSLAGHYDIKTENGRVKEIRLSSASSKDASIVRDRLEFIESFSSALAPGLSSVRKDSVAKNSKNKKEVYVVNSAEGESRFEFTMDRTNHLISLTVEPMGDF